MSQNELILLNFKEIRRRSIKVWHSIPQGDLDWRPDSEAMSCAEMIRHVVESEFLYHKILLAGGSKDIENIHNPFDTKKFISVEDELNFISPWRKDFLSYIENLSEDELKYTKIHREEAGYVRILEDMLLRIGYHESVHTGQILDYMRLMKIPRPNIWD
ncbi:DinB family protein [Alkalihalobacillus trypoxylicola]|uniref:DinB-like domain-containing protein n=1 Tax=Alkalihalobacillus trypoxylicola TaxID=519424 RepID=A0A161P5C0_9BACI|nr:DinB family protein [Alkalihalobacillus trypoxylicola]KYG26069.1 hypothetical protein AZF04_13365 [Alkalihalobacillus trypoxylicola]